MRLDPLNPNINKISRFQKSKMAAAAILKIQKIAISPQRNDRCDQIWYNYVFVPFRLRQPITFHKFEKAKNANMFGIYWPILTKFGVQMRLDPPDPNNQ